MDSIILLPALLAAVAGIFLLIWSFADHIKCKNEQETLKITHTVSVVALFTTAVLTISLCVGRVREFTLFVIMKNIPICFRTDALSRWFVCAVTIVWVLVGVYSLKYLKHEGDEKRFFGFFLLLYGVLICLDFSANLVTMYLFYELMTLCSLPLVLHNGSREAIMASLKYLFYSMCGAYLGLFGIFVIYNKVGNIVFVPGGHVTAAVLADCGGLLLPAVLAMIIGFGCKAGMFPLHAWLPTAHPVAPSPASAALSGIIVKAGVLAIIRTVFYVVGAEALRGTYVMNVAMILALLTVFMGSLLAYREPVLKKRLAYSTVSQVSYILFGLFVLTPEGFSGALLHVLFHAVVKCGLFLTAGIFLFKCHITRVDELKGIGKKMPVTLACYTVFALALIGIPPTSGFVSKFFLAEGALNANIGAFSYIGPAILLISALLTAGYLLPITMKGFFPGEDTEVKRAEASKVMLIPLIILAALALLCGLFPNVLINYVSANFVNLF